MRDNVEDLQMAAPEQKNTNTIDSGANRTIWRLYTGKHCQWQLAARAVGINWLPKSWCREPTSHLSSLAFFSILWLSTRTVSQIKFRLTAQRTQLSTKLEPLQVENKSETDTIKQRLLRSIKSLEKHLQTVSGAPAPRSCIQSQKRVEIAFPTTRFIRPEEESIQHSWCRYVDKNLQGTTNLSPDGEDANYDRKKPSTSK